MANYGALGYVFPLIRWSTGVVDPVNLATGGSTKSVWTVEQEHRQLIYGEMCCSMWLWDWNGTTALASYDDADDVS